MSSKVPLTLLLLVSLELTFHVTQADQVDSCNILNGEAGTPAGNDRICSVFKRSSNLGSNHCTSGSSSYCHQWISLGCDAMSSCDPNCPGFVGMNLTYKCSFDGARLYRYKDGEYQYLNGSSVNYGLLLPEHAGLYECRNSTDAVHAQNITVNDEVRISSVGSRCLQFYRNHERKCCYASSIWSPGKDASYQYQFVVYANPVDVSVTVEQVEWLVDKETRNDVDLGLYVEQVESNPVIWSIGLKRFPYSVTIHPPEILFRVTANTTNSSHSMCNRIKLEYETKSLRVENTSLPENKTVSEGEDALFQCKLSYTNLDVAAEFEVNIEVEIPIRIENETIHETCTAELDVISLINRTNCSLVQIERNIIFSNSLSQIVEFNVQIPQVTANLTGSAVSCSLVLISSKSLQWKRKAHLTVIERVNSGITQLAANVTISVSETASSAYLAVSLAVTVVVVLSVVLLAVGITVVLKKRRNHHAIVNPDEVPLTCSSQNSEPSTPVDQHNGRLLSIEIRGGKGAPMISGGGIRVGEQAQRLIDTYSGIIDSEMSSVHTFKTRPVTEFNRTIDVYKPSEFTEFVIYISYTDVTSEWVRNELKPIIESLHPVIRVDIHEDSMIPGFSISDERYRLILGADKIVIVVSSDYATSEWCVYELEHAIHQKPALCNGRVIPILTEINNCLPRIINGVVCLCTAQDDFKSRLHQAIFKKPNSMNCLT